MVHKGPPNSPQHQNIHHGKQETIFYIFNALNPSTKIIKGSKASFEFAPPSLGYRWRDNEWLRNLIKAWGILGR